MRVKWFWRAIFFLFVIAGLVLGGAAIYQLGFSQGAMTNMTLPEASEHIVAPFRNMHPGGYGGARAGFLGFFPMLLCFGGFFFLMLMFIFGFGARRRAWRHCGPGSHPKYWKHHGPPPWGAGQPPTEDDQTKKETDTGQTKTEE